ncbi:MAG: S-methyl-5-thioribose-1-phosphate isomerase [Planctomycetes bacterium]|nr:S-methyl-5-thioribose-1-phosphate isomerase [Planctomycetota bacterium]
MIVETLKWIGGIDGYLELTDQRQLPGKYVKLECRDIGGVYDAIKTLAVRGAPAIGVAGAYGVIIGMQKLAPESATEQGVKVLIESCEYLNSSRPTAVNLSWALNRLREEGEKIADQKVSLKVLMSGLLSEADAIYNEDIEMCRKMGENGEKFIKDGAGILTHCNAGALATAGQGTALSLMFEAHKKGKKFKVYADETRPLLQGARLTCWELQQAGIDVTVISDNMAGWLMKQGKIDAVITGADRIAANGDAANKIGTYSLSILAAENRIPFYIVAPSSTFDLSIKSGEQIPIEERSPDEVTQFGGIQVAPDGIKVYNPAFDVTSASNITAIITEAGVIEKPNTENIAKCLGK